MFDFLLIFLLFVFICCFIYALVFFAIDVIRNSKILSDLNYFQIKKKNKIDKNEEDLSDET